MRRFAQGGLGPAPPPPHVTDTEMGMALLPSGRAAFAEGTLDGCREGAGPAVPPPPAAGAPMLASAGKPKGFGGTERK